MTVNEQLPPGPTDEYKPSEFKMEVPEDVSSSPIWRRLTLFQFIYSLLGILLGAACIGVGAILVARGIGGSTSWSTKLLGVESTLTDATPGVVLWVLGLFVLVLTRFSVRVRGKSGNRKAEDY